MARIGQIEDRVEWNDYAIGELEKVVDSKKQRFADMDFFAKFTWRSKEL